MENDVSIIIPTYKRGDVVAKTLPSYLRQKHVQEVIIVDDGGFAYKSLEKMIKGNKLIRYYSPDKRLGLPGARNYGVGHAKGKYIAFGEDDVEFSDSYISKMRNEIIRHNADAVCGRQIFVFDEETKQSALKNADKLKKKDLYICYPTDVNFSVDLKMSMKMHTLMPFSLIKASIFKKIKFDEQLRGNYHREETDFFVRARQNGFQLVFSNRDLVWHLRYLSGSGGCRTQARLSLEASLLKNNVRFWQKNHKFLKKELGLRGPLLWYAAKYSLSRYFTFFLRLLRRV
jgi:GT2 family glycosyltransferase